MKKILYLFIIILLASCSTSAYVQDDVYYSAKKNMEFVEDIETETTPVEYVNETLYDETVYISFGMNINSTPFYNYYSPWSVNFYYGYPWYYTPYPYYSPYYSWYSPYYYSWYSPYYHNNWNNYTYRNRNYGPRINRFGGGNLPRGGRVSHGVKKSPERVIRHTERVKSPTRENTQSRERYTKPTQSRERYTKPTQSRERYIKPTQKPTQSRERYTKPTQSRERYIKPTQKPTQKNVKNYNSPRQRTSPNTYSAPRKSYTPRSTPSRSTSRSTPSKNSGGRR